MPVGTDANSIFEEVRNQASFRFAPLRKQWCSKAVMGQPFRRAFVFTERAPVRSASTNALRGARRAAPLVEGRKVSSSTGARQPVFRCSVAGGCVGRKRWSRRPAWPSPYL